MGVLLPVLGVLAGAAGADVILLLRHLRRCPHTPGGITGCSCRHTGPSRPGEEQTQGSEPGQAKSPSFVGHPGAPGLFT